jgi:hypothetical protein
MKNIFTALAIVSLAACAPLSANIWGQWGAPEQADRAIAITQATKYVNVTNGEVVTFLANGKTFTWYFDSPQGLQSFRLNTIAPAGALDHTVTAYVAPNPLYE